MTSGTGAPPVTWRPGAQERDGSRMAAFVRFLGARGVHLEGYAELHVWSVGHLAEFWDAVREFFEVVGDGFEGALAGDRVLVEDRMPGAVWYPDVRLSFAENALRHARDPQLADEPAVLTLQETAGPGTGTPGQVSWRELETQVASLAHHLRRLGVRPGDRVAAVLPNLPETVVALMATASVGAVWSVCSPDLSAQAVLDRTAQLEPVLLIGVDGYRWNGADLDLLDHLARVEQGLPRVRHTLLVRHADPRRDPGDRLAFDELLGEQVRPRYERVPFDHPLWVLFSSGTTGRPKGIVHGHGGIVLEGLKMFALQHDAGPGDRYYVAASTSWVVWNLMIETLLGGATAVTYPGSPVAGGKDRLFANLAASGATHFCTGAAYLQLVERSGAEPGREHDLSRLRSVLSTGSPLPPSTWLWFHRAVGEDVHLGSDSGGTDVASGFLGSNPLQPVHLGELQGALLGVDVQAWDEDGVRVRGEVGEMVIARPMPSMPVHFWDDEDGTLYRAAYFEQYPGVWRHGDWVTETARGGWVLHGRSDATLNRGGVRLGSAEIYAALEDVPEVVGSMVIGAELPDGGYVMPLFVVLEEGRELDAALTARIKDTIRARTSARHVPDEVVQAPAIPTTHSGKRVEVPVKRLFSGIGADRAVNLGALANPEAMVWFIEHAERFRGGPEGAGRVRLVAQRTGSGDRGMACTPASSGRSPVLSDRSSAPSGRRPPTSRAARSPTTAPARRRDGMNLRKKVIRSSQATPPVNSSPYSSATDRPSP